MPLHQGKQLLHLVWLGLAVYLLEVHQFAYVSMGKDVVTPADP